MGLKDSLNKYVVCSLNHLGDDTLGMDSSFDMDGHVIRRRTHKIRRQMTCMEEKLSLITEGNQN